MRSIGTAVVAGMAMGRRLTVRARAKSLPKLAPRVDRRPPRAALDRGHIYSSVTHVPLHLLGTSSHLGAHGRSLS